MLSLRQMCASSSSKCMKGLLMKKSVLAGACVAALGVAALSGCSSNSEEAMVGGMTECTMEAVQSSLDEAAKALGADNVVSDATLSCADGWAVVSGILGAADAPSDGPQGAPTTFIFQQEGQFWIPKEKSAVCGTLNGDAYPADAEVPEALYTEGCLSG